MPATVFVRFDAPGPVEATPRRLHAAWGRVLDLPEGVSPERAARLLESLTRHARATMLQGAPLVHRVPGRAGWELRAVVQAALSVLAQTRALGPRALATRPVLRRRDAPRVLWRCLLM